MKNLINKIKQNPGLVSGILIAGLVIGFMIGRPSRHHEEETPVNQQISQSSTRIWTCSMHPQIRLDHPGKCPICGMDLIPLQDFAASDSTKSSNEILMTDDAIKLADIQTMMVKKAYPIKEIDLLGKVKSDERNIAELTARFGGRIEKLYVNFTGQDVKKGEKLVTIYSPVLVTAQKELLEAQEYKLSNPELYLAARNKLRLWDLTDEQIDNIEQKGEVQSYFDVLSPIAGTVTRRDVSRGDYVKEGSPLFQVTDLTNIWIMFEAYESDLPWIKTGDDVRFTVESFPGKKFNGRINFIDPVIDPKTRIAQARVEVRNPGLLLKPEMFVNGVVNSTIAGNKKNLMVPKTAVLWTGKRAVVYVKVPDRDQPSFKYREITLGPAAGDFYVVDNGLLEGEEIAVNGVFKIDAAAQLAGKPSMMNPGGTNASAMNSHGSMVMPGSDDE
jgi:Cu(I)/Ag(I) efflux system membrane fusion protein